MELMSGTQAMDNAGRFRLLDPLRGLAALWVFLFHYPFSTTFQKHFAWLHAFFKVGDRGVFLFFVISGYCLALAARQSIRKQDSIGQFLARRAWRIYPTFWCSILFIVLCHWLLGAILALAGVTGWPVAAEFEGFSVWGWIKVATLTQYFDQKVGFFFGRFGAINGAYWTLAVEVQFYIVVALGLLWPRRFYPWLFLITLLSVPALFSERVFGLVANAGLFLSFWFPFALGAGLFALVERNWTPARVFGTWATRVALTSMTLLVFAMLVLIALGHEIPRTGMAMGFVCFLWMATALERPGIRESWQRGRCWNLLTKLGAMSYSLYLMHNPVSGTLLALAPMVHLGSGMVPDPIVVCLTVVICYGFYRICEAPFVRSRKTVTQSVISLAHPASAKAA